MKRFVKAIMQLLFPPHCVCCDKVIAPSQMPICTACRKAELPRIETQTCARCGRGKVQCSCDKATLLSDSIAAPFYYTKAAKDAVKYFKRVEDTDRTAFLTSEMTRSAYIHYADTVVDIITAVPMHKQDAADRGFNGVETLAKRLADELHVAYAPLLHKRYHTQPQKELPAIQRYANLLGAFDVRDARLVKDKTILLVDDVVTTGGTTNECAKMLKIYGAKAVYVLAFAVSENKKKEQETKTEGM